MTVGDFQGGRAGHGAHRRRVSVRMCVSALGLLTLLRSGSLEAQSGGRFREEVVHIQGPLKGLRLGVHHVVRSGATARDSLPIVLILHGSAVPVSGNPAYPFGGRSMMQALADDGLDVWSVDFYGFGASDRYPEMNEAPGRHPPLGTAEQQAKQTDSVVAFLRRRYSTEQIDLIGLSGGNMTAGLYAARHHELISRLILFGPVTPFTAGPAPETAVPAYDFVTPQSLWSSFTSRSQKVAGPPVLDSTMYEGWAATYLDSDPTSRTRTPASVRVPSGWQADLAAISTGRFPYDPGAIRAATLVVMGEWDDDIATFAGAEWLLKRLRQAAQRRLAVIGRGSHTIQFEAERTQLYRVMADFLNEKERGRGSAVSASGSGQ